MSEVQTNAGYQKINMSDLQKLYHSKIADELKKELGFANVERIPKLVKIVINVGSGEIGENKAHAENIQQDLRRISGQKPVITKAKKAISAFKVRQGNSVGMMVTLRGTRMYDFLHKLISITVPRVRDFRGFSPNSFDGHGNFSLGLKEQSVFNEIPYESIAKPHGLQITIQTTAKTNTEGMLLLKALGFPFTKNTKGVQNGA